MRKCDGRLIMRGVAVGGVGMIRFGRYPEKDYQDFGFEAVKSALDDAQMKWRDVQAVFTANAYSGMAVGHNIAARFGKTGIPVVNVENACSGGSSAFRLCYQSVSTGMYDVCLAIGVESIPGGLLDDTSWPIHERIMGFNVQPGNYALELQRHMEMYGTTLEQVAMVTVKNRHNGVLNPYAGFQKAVTLDEVLTSRMIATPLRLLMCCANGDGAAATVVCASNKVKNGKKQVNIAAAVLTSETYGNKKGAGSLKYINPDRTEIAAKQAYEDAGIGSTDLDVAEVYDTMASSEIINSEKLGFCKKGEYGPRLEQNGEFKLGSKLPINPSGGLMSRRHPLSATGLAQIAEVVWQLRGEAGRRQVPGAKLGLCHCLGAGGNCAITILKS
jgi:acetyl-CoA acetyltransferase